MSNDQNSLQDYLLQGDKEALVQLYKDHRLEFIQWCIQKYDISKDQAMEAYQEAVIIFYENIVSGKLTDFSSSAKTYLFAIGKNKLREFFRASVKMTNQEDSLLELVHEDTIDDKEPFFKIMEKNIQKLNERCRELLNLYYYRQLSMDQITDRLAYKNVDSTKNQKYKCLKQLREYCEEEVRS